MILVVDDDPGIRESLSRELRAAGFATALASDGREGLRKLHACHPSVVLLDLTMPGMDGWAFRAAQRVDPEVSRIPVIVVSALGRVDDLDAAEFIQKPFELDQLLTAVRHHARA